MGKLYEQIDAGLQALILIAKPERAILAWEHPA